MAESGPEIQHILVTFSGSQFYIPGAVPGTQSLHLALAVKVKVAQSWPTLCNPMDCPWNSPGQNTGPGGHSLLQGIFPTQGLNPGLPHCWQILYQLTHKGSPRILEWVAYPFSRGCSRPRNWTGVSCIAGRFFTNWATRESLAVNTDKSPLRKQQDSEGLCIRNLIALKSILLVSALAASMFIIGRQPEPFPGSKMV